MWPLVGLLVALTMLLATFGVPQFNDPQRALRADASLALRALRSGDIAVLDRRLSAHRGDADFAYYFASKATPRELGDAVAGVGDARPGKPLKTQDGLPYQLAVTNLANTLGLATYGMGDRALPNGWTLSFIRATVEPELASGGSANTARAHQDVANRSNLLQLIARGGWSRSFLQAVCAAYWEHDQDKGSEAWPHKTVSDAAYAPTLGGARLTDGILALTAALTANPAASKWAFVDFQPGTTKIEGTKYQLGKFAHFLLFEHRFPGGSEGSGAGMTATLTALSSAIQATGGTAEGPSQTEPAGTNFGPTHDAIVLQAVARKAATDFGCSIDPRDVINCVEYAAAAVLHWAQQWGHLVLDILTQATFAPPPFDVVGSAAAGVNATWYAIDGDYSSAGLSLASAVPGLAFTKIGKALKKGATAEKALSEEEEVAAAATAARGELRGADAVRSRVTRSPDTDKQIFANAERDAQGNFIDANTKQSIPPGAKHHVGHKPGNEWRCTQAKAIKYNWTRQQVFDYENDPSRYQIEDARSNQSHAFESKVCAA